MQENRPLLNKPEIQPTADVLKNVLKESYNAFEELSTILTNEYNFTMNWKYYKDSKAWLCKVAYKKKKTIFWLSVWDGYFRTSFYFLESHLDNFTLKKEWGKMVPIIFNVYSSEQFPDLLKMIEKRREITKRK
jgi:hypothetical protein